MSNTSFRKPDDPVPLIYFDLAPAFGFADNVILVELYSRILTVDADNKIVPDNINVARLRCSPAAAQRLCEALQGALKMLDDKVGLSGSGEHGALAPTSGTVN